MKAVVLTIKSLMNNNQNLQRFQLQSNWTTQKFHQEITKRHHKQRYQQRWTQQQIKSDNRKTYPQKIYLEQGNKSINQMDMSGHQISWL